LRHEFEKFDMMITSQKIARPKSQFFKMVLEDKRSMSEYVKKHGTLNGYKSDNFEFAKPIPL